MLVWVGRKHLGKLLVCQKSNDFNKMIFFLGFFTNAPAQGALGFFPGDDHFHVLCKNKLTLPSPLLEMSRTTSRFSSWNSRSLKPWRTPAPHGPFMGDNCNLCSLKHVMLAHELVTEGSMQWRVESWLSSSLHIAHGHISPTLR